MSKKLVLRADDVGYTEAFDMGVVRAIDEGLITSADVMLDCKHSVEALKMLKERPWIALGWHRHLWGWPVAGAENVPSLVNAAGRFFWGHDEYAQGDAAYEDCIKEFEAELALCLRIYGKYPVTASATIFEGKRPIDRAMIDICKKYDIKLNIDNHSNEDQTPVMPEMGPFNPEYHKLNYRYGPGGFTVKRTVRVNNQRLADFESFQPLERIKSMTWRNEEETLSYSVHPGYLDDFILAESSYNIHRVKELQDIVSPELKRWVIENEIELVSTYDVLNGTREYQKHLAEINSPVWIENIRKVKLAE